MFARLAFAIAVVTAATVQPAHAQTPPESPKRWGRLRIEARNYVAGFKPLEGGRGSATRNDVVVMTGLRFGR